MRSVEVEGESIDEAIARALRALGAAREEVQIDILDSAPRGLLGLGRRRARVRATMRAPLTSWDGDGAVVAPHESAGDEDAARDAAAADPGAAVRPAPASDRAPAFDAAAFLVEVLRRMGLPGRVHAAADATTSTLTVAPAEAAATRALRTDVLHALALVVARVAERQAGDRRRVVVRLDGQSRASERPQDPHRDGARAPETVRGRHRGRRR